MTTFTEAISDIRSSCYSHLGKVLADKGSRVKFKTPVRFGDVRLDGARIDYCGIISFYMCGEPIAVSVYELDTDTLVEVADNIEDNIDED